MGEDDQSASVTAEKIIAKLRRKKSDNPFCWVMCYEKRPLQGAPQNSRQPHLMIFNSMEAGEAFIKGRSRYFGPEPLKLVPVDSPGTLLKLALAEADDSRYSPPPCGLLLNFSYFTGQADESVSPEEVQEIDGARLAEALGLEIPGGEAEETPHEEPAPAEPEEPTHCPICRHKLYMPRRGGISIGFGDSALEAMMSRQSPDLAHTAYACKKCGTRICQTCATKYVCPRCKNNTFDRFDVAALPPPPPEKPSKPKAAPAAKAAAKPEKPVAEPAVKAPPVPVREAVAAAVPAAAPVAVPAPIPAARPAPRWWMLALGVLVVLAVVFLVTRPWQGSVRESAPVASSPDPMMQAASTVSAHMTQIGPTVPASNPVLMLGADSWVLTDQAFVHNIAISGRESREPPEGSEFLAVAFRCRTARNPLEVMDGVRAGRESMYNEKGIQDVYLSDETGATHPFTVIEVFYKDGAPESFLMLAPVEVSKDTYILHFLDAAPLPLNPALVSQQAQDPAPEPTSTMAIVTEVVATKPAPTQPVAEVIPTLAPFSPFALPGGGDYGAVVALSPKDTYAASGNCQGEVRLWLTGTREVFKDYALLKDECVRDIAFSTDENRMAVSLSNGSIFLVDVLTHDLIGQLFMPEVRNVEISPRGGWLAAGSNGNATALWDLKNAPEGSWTDWEPVIIDGRADNTFTCLEFDPTDEYLAIGEALGGVKLWDLKAGQVAYSIDADCAAPRSMSFSLGRDYGGFLYFSDARSQNVVNLSTGDLQVVRTFPFRVDEASAFVPRVNYNAQVILRPGDFKIELWNNYENQLLHTLKGHTVPIFSIQFNTDGRLLLSGGIDFAMPNSGEVYLWNTSEMMIP